MLHGFAETQSCQHGSRHVCRGINLQNSNLHLSTLGRNWGLNLYRQCFSQSYSVCSIRQKILCPTTLLCISSIKMCTVQGLHAPYVEHFRKKRIWAIDIIQTLFTIISLNSLVYFRVFVSAYIFDLDFEFVSVSSQVVRTCQHFVCM